MYRRLLLAAAVTAAMCSAVQAAPLVVGFLKLVQNPVGALRKPRLRNKKRKSVDNTQDRGCSTKQENQIKL